MAFTNPLTCFAIKTREGFIWLKTNIGTVYIGFFKNLKIIEMSGESL